MSSPANDPAFTSWPRSPKRLHQIDPGLALADMFDPAIARRLWDSLPRRMPQRSLRQEDDAGALPTGDPRSQCGQQQRQATGPPVT